MPDCEVFGAPSEDACSQARRLCSFIQASPSAFHAVDEITSRLRDVGFRYLPENAAWSMEPGGCYFTTRNASSVIAWRIGDNMPEDGYHFQIAASHSDSPAFKVKDAAELSAPGNALRLNVEAYGGMIDYTWFDRPLGLAGRVMVRDGSRIESRLLFVDRPVALIPSVAIHMNREVNKGFAPDRQVDACPLFSAGALGAGSFDAFLAGELGVDPAWIVGRDVFLVSLEAARIWGAADEFVSAPRLDDLMCAHASLEAFLSAKQNGCVSVYCCFDNEEVGSNTKQGAMSTMLRDVLERINDALGFGGQDLRRALAASMMASCDNAHAAHPNHPEKADEGNRCFLNGGIVVKEAANQAYCTDAFSRAVFTGICADAGVPVQRFANKSNMAGGSTLGNLSNIQASMHAVDIGCPQIAMHSSYETAGVLDALYARRALEAFFETDIRIDGASSATLVSPQEA